MKAKDNPDWLKRIVPEKFNDDKLLKIVLFYVFYSPCANSSARSRSITDYYHWSSPWKSPFYLNKQLIAVSSTNKLIFAADNNNTSMEQALKRSNLEDFPPATLPYSYEEKICIYDSESNQFMSIFKHIRNSLSHGRLTMYDVHGECVFAFEDVSPRSKNVSARMILSEDTLLKWIEIIEGGEKEYHKVQRKSSDKKQIKNLRRKKK